MFKRHRLLAAAAAVAASATVALTGLSAASASPGPARGLGHRALAAHVHLGHVEHGTHHHLRRGHRPGRRPRGQRQH